MSYTATSADFVSSFCFCWYFSMNQVHVRSSPYSLCMCACAHWALRAHSIAWSVLGSFRMKTDDILYLNICAACCVCSRHIALLVCVYLCLSRTEHRATEFRFHFSLLHSIRSAEYVFVSHSNIYKFVTIRQRRRRRRRRRCCWRQRLSATHTNRHHTIFPFSSARSLRTFVLWFFVIHFVSRCVFAVAHHMRFDEHFWHSLIRSFAIIFDTIHTHFSRYRMLRCPRYALLRLSIVRANEP